MKNMIKQNLKMQYKGLILWIVALTFFIYISMVKFDTINQSAGVKDLLETFPRIILIMFGMEGLDVTKIDGYYASVYLFLIVLTCLYAGNRGSKMVLNGDNNKVCDFIYTKPVLRLEIYIATLLSNIIILTLFQVLLFVISFISLLSYNIDILFLIKLSIAMYVANLVFMSIGQFFSAMLHNENAPTITSSFVLFAYFLSIVCSLYDNNSMLSIFTIFSGYNIYNGINIVPYLFYLALSIIFISFGYKNLKSRDIR